MLFDLFFSPISDAIAQTRRYTEPAVSVIPPGSCGIPASKMWFALSQIPIAIVNDALFEALSSIEYAPEPTPEIEPKPAKPSKSKAVKENLYGKAINVLADAIVLGESTPEPPVPTPTEPDDLPFPEMPTADDAPVEDVGNGGNWKPSVANPALGFGTKEYDSKSEADYYKDQSQVWCYAARVVKVSKGRYRLEAGDISRDRWEQICRGNPNRLARQPKPKRERLTETMESRKRQLELEPIAELREKYRRALIAGFHPSFSVSTISRDHLVKALIEAADWEFSRAA